MNKVDVKTMLRSKLVRAYLWTDIKNEWYPKFYVWKETTNHRITHKLNTTLQLRLTWYNLAIQISLGKLE